MFDLERFIRQPKDGERMIELAARRATGARHRDEYDLRTPNGKKAFGDAINAAADHSNRLSTRTARGKKLKALEASRTARRGRLASNPISITVHEDEAAFLRDLTARFLAGETQDALIAEWNGRGITTSAGKPWTRAGLRKLLTRQRNCGRIIYTDSTTGPPRL